MSFKLYAVRVFALDWEAVTAFYRETIELPEKFSDRDMGWAEFDLGGPSLAIERTSPADAESEDLKGRFLGISLTVDDMDEVYERLVDRGVKFLGPPARQPWGGILAHFEDPEGNVVTLLGSPADG